MTRTAFIIRAVAMTATIAVATPAFAQSVTAEVAQTGGYSTDDSAAAALQGRVFGDTVGDLRFTVEGAWAARSGDGTDAFGAAYPYDSQVKLIEAFAERTFRPRGSLIAVRGGRFRTPFGIASASDHAYSGFLRAPLIRYDNYYALSNNFLEQGVSVVAGLPSLFVEATLGAPGDVGEAERPHGLDRVVRLQGAYRSAIVGVSHIVTRPYQDPRFARGHATFTGIDARWMHRGLEVRGEWIAGRPFDGTTTTGGYVDVRLHTSALGVVTPVFRAERLAYDTDPRFAIYPHRFTAGSRVHLHPRLTAQFNVIRQHAVPGQGNIAFDAALSYVVRFAPARGR
jgi:hypothetical protein